MSASVNLSSNASDDVGASSNNTSLRQNCPLTGVFVGLSQVSIAIHAITLLASLVGNTLLITIFVRIKEPIMLPIANMAVSDLLVAIFLIPRLIARDVIGSNAFLVQGNGGLFLCKMCTFLSDISLSVSTLSLVLIAVERFLAVVYPMVYKKITVKVRRFLVASTWIMAMAFHSPYFYTMRLVANANHQLSTLFKRECRQQPAANRLSKLRGETGAINSCSTSILIALRLKSPRDSDYMINQIDDA
ncbi:neuromedin U receptor [Desmophyllum pertusum]|uniref:Neuromedin U receptor n=1 Tax=Desmophyllum pertusum TaxID=174260 RepID=A0A9X0A3Y6_9CNID|nr:neuromedin U receptor [Desmophyllum pertusum]